MTFKGEGAIFNHVVEQKAYDLDRIFHALADPTRRSILAAVARKPCSVTELAGPFKVSLAAVSKHIQVLEGARLVERRKEGRVVTARLNAEALKTAEEWLAEYRRFWGIRLDALEAMLMQDEEGGSENT